MCIHYYQHIWSIIDKSYLDVRIICAGGVTVQTNKCFLFLFWEDKLSFSGQFIVM